MYFYPYVDKNIYNFYPFMDKSWSGTVFSNPQFLIHLKIPNSQLVINL